MRLSVLTGLVARSDSHCGSVEGIGGAGRTRERLVDFCALSRMKKQSMPWFYKSVSMVHSGLGIRDETYPSTISVLIALQLHPPASRIQYPQ
jgi:hypothetical protein